MKIFQTVTIEMVENIEKCETCGVTLEPSFAHIPPLLYEGFFEVGRFSDSPVDRDPGRGP